MRRQSMLFALASLAVPAALMVGQVPAAAQGTWTLQDSHTHHTELPGVFMIDANNGWLVGGESSGASENGDRVAAGQSVVRHTTDGGANWVEDAGATNAEAAAANGGLVHELKKVYFVGNAGWIIGESDDDNACTAGTASEQVILHTTDAGLTWTRQTSNSCNDLEDIYMIDASNGYVTAGPEIAGTDPARYLTTNDGGTNWVSHAFAGTPHGCQLPGGSSTASSFVRDTVSFPPKAGSTSRQEGWIIDADCILHTTNAGASWDRQAVSGDCSITWDNVDATTATCGSFEYMTCVDTNNCWAGADGDPTAATGSIVAHWDGSSWVAHKVDRSGASCLQHDFDGVMFFNTMHGFAFGELTVPANAGGCQDPVAVVGHETGMMFETFDGGLTWTAVTLPAGTGQLVHGRIADSCHANVVGQGGTAIAFSDPSLCPAAVVVPTLPKAGQAAGVNPLAGWVALAVATGALLGLGLRQRRA